MSGFESAMKAAGSGTEMVGGVIAYLISQGKRDEAMKLYHDSLADMSDLDVPAFEEQIAQEIQKQKDVTADPAVREAQMSAMGKMGSLADAGGLDPQAQQALQESRQSMDQQFHGQNQAIMSGMARRGMAGSGDELSAQLSAAQGSANRGNQAGLTIAADSRKRALQALQGQSDMAGNIRAGDNTEGQQNRNAAMERDKFNSNMRAAAQSGNIAQRQALFNLHAKKAGLVNTARGNLATQIYDDADRQQKAISGTARGMNEGASASGSAWGDSF